MILTILLAKKQFVQNNLEIECRLHAKQTFEASRKASQSKNCKVAKIAKSLIK